MRIFLFVILASELISSTFASRTTKEDSNLKVVRELSRENINNWEKIIDSKFKHHLPYMKDGKQSYIESMKNFFKRYPNYKDEGSRYFVDGDFVIVHGIGTTELGDTGVAVGIYKVLNGKVVELWHVNQTVPKESRNVNPMF